MENLRRLRTNTDFRNLDDPADKSFEPHPTDYPVTELEYPNTGASERFILVVPKDKDHYNPIMCLENTLHTIIEYYLTPAQRALFGTLPSNNLVDDDCPVPPPLIPHISTSEFTETSSPPSVISSASSPASSLLSESSSASSVSSATSLSSLSSLSSVSSLSSLASLSSLSALASHASQPSPSHPPSVNYLRLFQRAINKQDGPLFLKVMDAINALLRLLKYPPLPLDPFAPAPPNNLCAAVATWPRIPEKVLTRIVDETYQRAVGPHVAELKRYSAFSSEVYGELMPSFVAQIIATTGLGSDSLFVDLGSGVGNVVLQASLQTGCQSFGVEIMPDPAKIARSQLEQCKMRCRMWGVSMGEVELEEGDMLKSKRVDELVPKADVVLVNNKVFLESLNEAIRPKFLDLKEGAVVVSLKPFVSSQRLTGRNLDDISAIFQVTERPYYPGSVSWGNGSGSYFLHRVDREGYADRKAEFESSRNGSSRGTRSRR
ncbi:DOT1-domain-containing protein [Wolfiporia cocos MD-104 SS10]|uniref:Histone-lysine N-methyltransferase, H3 lysine-79 specific n=1 Tax=Wolfiporia cocos (strain MD-104) TaxID=742152 RepID=A0A2H3JAU3_WOLCO|nr:DOT1-domain-containing protein [Wolfiporia cocos MD-104 SS10]